MMNRRNFTGLMLTAAGTSVASSLSAKTTIREDIYVDILNMADTGLPANLPENIKKMIRNVLKEDLKNINTDWFGSIRIEGLLRFAKRGYKDGLIFAEKWFNYHVEHDGKMTDEEYFAQYSGYKSRIFRDGPLAFVIYSANLGVSFPIHELYLATKNPVAKHVCMDVADAVLHFAGRDKFGMLAHDDEHYQLFAIPDTAYWATRTTAVAATLSPDPNVAAIYWKQSIYQLEQGIKYFLDRDKKIVRTGLFKGEPSKTYWCRSQGWLLWAMGGLLRYLPKTHPKFKIVAADMQIIADGLKHYQGKNGGLHVLVNDPSTPEEATGMAMSLAALKEGVRKGWIKNNGYDEMFAKAWNYIQGSVDNEGNVHNAYTGWAVPAEEGQANKIDESFQGYVPGIFMVAADEMTR